MASQMSPEEIQRQLGFTAKQWKRLCAEVRAYLREIPPNLDQNVSIQWAAYAEMWLSSRDEKLPNKTIGEVIFQDTTIGSLHWPQDQRKITELIAQTLQYHYHEFETSYDKDMWTDNNSKAIDQGILKAPTASMIADPTSQQAKEAQSSRKPMAKRSRDPQDMYSKSKKQKASSGSGDQVSNNISEGENRKRQSTSVSSSAPEDPSLNLPLREVSNSATQEVNNLLHQHHAAAGSAKSASQEEIQTNGHHPQSIGNSVLVQTPITDPATGEKSETIFVRHPFAATTAGIVEEPVLAQENSAKERFQAVPTVSSPSTERTNRGTSNVANTSRPQQVLPVPVSPLPRPQATAMNSCRLRTKIIFRACDQSLGYFKDTDMRFESVDAFFEAIAHQINVRERINHLTFDFGEKSFKNVCVNKEEPDAHLDFHDILELAKKYELAKSSDHLNIGLSF